MHRILQACDRSLGLKLLAPAALGCAFAVIAARAVTTWLGLERANEQLSERAMTIAQTVTYAAEAVRDPVDLQRLVNALGGEQGVNVIVAVGGEPVRVIASTRNKWNGRLLSELPREEVGDDLEFAMRSGHAATRYHQNSQELDCTLPLRFGDRNALWFDGAVMVHVDARDVEAAVVARAWQVTGYAMTFSVGVFLTAWYILHQVVLRPVHAIVAAIAADTEAKPHADDSIGLLAQTFNARRAESNDTRAKLETALREIHALRFALDEHSILSIAGADGRIIDVNSGFCTISGFSRDELIGQDHRILNSGVHPKSFWVEMRRQIAEGRAWRGEVCNQSKDGSLYWVDSTIVPHVGIDGRVEKYISIRFDITKQKQAEAQRARSRIFLEQVLASMDSHIAILDDSGTIVLTNTAWQRFAQANSASGANFGVGANYLEVCEHARSDRSCAGSAQLVAGAIRGALTGSDDAIVVEYPCHSPTEQRWFQATIRRVEVSGEVYVCVLHYDVTRLRKALEEVERARIAAEAANRAKSEFLANMSHEIRTPLTAILGFADVLREDGAEAANPARRIELIDTIRNAGAHLLTIINDILDLSKIEAERMAVERVPTPFPAILLDVVTLMRPRIEGKGVALSAALETPIPDIIISDPTRLRQILMNLVSNAAKFTEEGEIRIAARVDQSEPLSRLVIDVIDTGSGIPPERAEELFQPFLQADTTVTRKHGGTGLGLAISRRLAALMGGQVVLARSQPLQGSTFRVRLPLEEAPGARLVDHLDFAPARGGAESGPTTTLSGRILLAEDGPDNQKLISFFLRRSGASVEVAENGRVALEMIEARHRDGRPYDLLITDIQMPEMDGYSLAQVLRERGNHMPIIALTAHAMADDRDRCLAAGCDDYASKPIDKAKLLATCAAWLGRRHTPSASKNDVGTLALR